MNKIITILIVLIFSSCASLEQAGKQAAYETSNAVTAQTIRKVQNGVTKRIDKTIDNIGNIGKRKSRRDSTTVQ